MSEHNASLDRVMAAVKALDDTALADFAAWFAPYHAAAWDAQIARDCADPDKLRILLGEFADDPRFFPVGGPGDA